MKLNGNSKAWLFTDVIRRSKTNMPIKTECPKCGARYGNIDEKLAGRMAPCKKCGTKFPITPLHDPDATRLSVPLQAATPGVRDMNAASIVGRSFLLSADLAAPGITTMAATAVSPDLFSHAAPTPEASAPEAFADVSPARGAENGQPRFMMRRGIRVISASPDKAGSAFQHVPLYIPQLKAASGGFDVNRGDRATIPYEAITLVSVFKTTEGNMKGMFFLFFAIDSKRPFIIETDRIHYKEFECVAGLSIQDSLRSLIGFLLDKNQEIMLDEGAYGFFDGGPINDIHCKTEVWAAALGELFKKQAHDPPENHQPGPVDRRLQPPSADPLAMINNISLIQPASPAPPCGPNAFKDTGISDIIEMTRRKIKHPKLYFAPDIPPGKLQKARNAYARLCPGEKALALLDITVFGGAGDGMLLSDAAVYTKDITVAPNRAAFREIQSIHFQPCMFNSELYINDRKVMDTIPIDMKGILPEIVDTVNRILRAVDPASTFPR